jgi:hypothetical protein
MKLKIREPNKPERMVEGQEARATLRSLLHTLGQSILMPEPPFTGLMRRRVVETLQQGRPVWTEPNHNGQVSDQSTIVALVRDLKIVGVIRADGTWDGEGPDPRRTGEGTGQP